MKSLSVHPEATTEAAKAREWYAERGTGTAEAFMRELDQAIEFIRSKPGACPPHVNGTRRYLLRRFPFSIVFRETDESIQVVAVAHSRRRPGYWTER